MNINETPRPSDGEPRPITLAQWRATIIDSICREGLKSGKMLREEGKNFLGSADNIDRDSIHSRSFCGLMIDMYDLLYGWSVSVLPVISERPSEPLLQRQRVLEPQKKELLAKRITSSFLIVGRDDPSIGDPPRCIPSTLFTYLIFPKTIWEEYSSGRSNLQSSIRIPIKITTDTLERFIGIGDHPIRVPDYETPLREIGKELKMPLFVHGVRLPTEEDLAKFTPVPQ